MWRKAKNVLFYVLLFLDCSLKCAPLSPMPSACEEDSLSLIQLSLCPGCGCSLRSCFIWHPHTPSCTLSRGRETRISSENCSDKGRIRNNEAIHFKMTVHLIVIYWLMRDKSPILPIQLMCTIKPNPSQVPFSPSVLPPSDGASILSLSPERGDCLCVSGGWNLVCGGGTIVGIVFNWAI